MLYLLLFALDRVTRNLSTIINNSSLTQLLLLYTFLKSNKKWTVQNLHRLWLMGFWEPSPHVEKMDNPIQWIWITQLISIKLIRCLTIKPVNSVIQRLKNCGARRLPEIKVHHNYSYSGELRNGSSLHARFYDLILFFPVSSFILISDRCV